MALLPKRSASTDEDSLFNTAESELILLLLKDWTAPLDLCASAACSHICHIAKSTTDTRRTYEPD